MASSKTFLSPFCVKAEHSRYLKVNQFRSQGGVPNGINLLCHLYALRVGYRGLSLLTKFLDRLPVFAEIEFCADQDNRDIRSMMRNLREPLTWSAWNSRDRVVRDLCLDVFEGGGRDEGKAN